MWWCGFSFDRCADDPPYRYQSMEREMGAFKSDRSFDGAALAMKRFAKELADLPEIPEREVDAIIVLSQLQDTWKTAFGSFILAKQAGFEIEFTNIASVDELPESNFYIVPCIYGYEVMEIKKYRLLLEAAAKDFIEEAMGIANLMQLWEINQEQAARMLGKSQSAVANKLRLLRHSAPVLEQLRETQLTERHARALLRLPTEAMKLRAIEHIKRLGMSVARAEQYIDSLLQDPEEKPYRADVGAFLKHVSQTLTKIQSSGIAAVSERRETEDRIVLTITIPKDHKA